MHRAYSQILNSSVDRGPHTAQFLLNLQRPLLSIKKKAKPPVHIKTNIENITKNEKPNVFDNIFR